MSVGVADGIEVDVGSFGVFEGIKVRVKVEVGVDVKVRVEVGVSVKVGEGTKVDVRLATGWAVGTTVPTCKATSVLVVGGSDTTNVGVVDD